MDQQLYELPDGWEWKTLTDVTQFIGGSQPPKSEFSEEKKEGYTRLIQIRDYKTDNYIIYVKTKSTKKFCDTDDVMIGRYGPPVFQILRGLKGAYNVALMKAVPNDGILTKDYLYHFLKSSPIQNYIIGLSQRAAGQTGVNKNALEKYAIPLPPLSEQKRIVEKLDSFLSRIDQAINHLQESLGLAETLFASSLDGSFNPLGSIKNTEGIYELPDGWEWKKLEDIITNTKNINPTSLPAQEWTYIDISSINSNKNIIENPKIIIGKEAPSRAKKEVIVNDVLFATTRPNLKNIAFVDTVYNNPVASTGFCILRATQAVNYKYLFYFLVTDIVQKQIEPFISGASYPAITDANLKRISFPLPLLSEQKRIVEKLDDLSIQKNDLKEKLQSQIDDLIELKASLLDSAFRGEL